MDNIEDAAAIRDLIDTWMRASKAGDHATVLSLIADDAVFMVPGHEPFGKEAFAAASKEQADLRIEGTSEIRELQVLGDWAWLRSYITVSMTMPDGQTSRRQGYTLTILRKLASGKWVLARDANLLAPAP